MPNIASAKKALRVSKRRQKVNTRVSKEYREQVKDLKLSSTKGGKTLTKKLASVYSKVDAAVKKGVIHKKKASRIKSRMSGLVKKAQTTKKK